MCAVLAATHIRSDQLPGFDDAYRTHQPQAEPLNWNTPIGKEQSLTLGDFLHSLLDQHINGNLCAGNVEWLLSLVRELLGKYGDTNVPVSRQEYTRLIDLLKDNARFYLTCASHVLRRLKSVPSARALCLRTTSPLVCSLCVTHASG